MDITGAASAALFDASRDVNVGESYSALDSDVASVFGSDDESVVDDGGEGLHVPTWCPWDDSDDEDDSDVDVNADDELLHSRRRRQELQRLEADGWEDVPPSNTREDEYPGLFDGERGPTHDAVDAAEDPMRLFFLVFPKQLFHVMARESSRYAVATMNDRAKKAYKQQLHQVARGERKLDEVESVDENERRMLATFVPFTPLEYVRLVSLCIMRMLQPHPCVSSHWNPTAYGAIPAGTFQRIMSKDRFDELVKCWRPADNADPRARHDRIWKLRPREPYSTRSNVYFVRGHI